MSLWQQRNLASLQMTKKYLKSSNEKWDKKASFCVYEGTKTKCMKQENKIKLYWRLSLVYGVCFSCESYYKKSRVV